MRPRCSTWRSSIVIAKPNSPIQEMRSGLYDQRHILGSRSRRLRVFKGKCTSTEERGMRSRDETDQRVGVEQWGRLASARAPALSAGSSMSQRQLSPGRPDHLNAPRTGRPLQHQYSYFTRRQYLAAPQAHNINLAAQAALAHKVATTLWAPATVSHPLTFLYPARRAPVKLELRSRVRPGSPA